MTQNKLRRKGFVWLIGPYLFFIKERTETHAGQEPRDRSWCRGHRVVLLTGLYIMAYLAYFIIEPRMTSPGMAAPTMAWTLPHQSLIRKCLIGWITAQSYKGT